MLYVTIASLNITKEKLFKNFYSNKILEAKLLLIYVSMEVEL